MPVHLEPLDVSASLENFRSVLIVSCPVCPPVSLAVQRSSPLIELFKRGLKTGAFEDYIQEIRATGLWIGIELKPEAGGARQYCEKLMGAGILCKETHDHIIRFAPPLVISKDDVDWALETIGKTLFT